MKKEIKEKLDKWNKMSIEEKLKYNGFDGFLRDEFFSDTSLFKNKAKRR